MLPSKACPIGRGAILSRLVTFGKLVTGAVGAGTGVRPEGGLFLIRNRKEEPLFLIYYEMESFAETGH